MTSEELLEALRRRPFNPFAIHVDEVTSYYVPTSEYVAHKPDSILAVVLNVTGPGFNWIPLSHISKLSFDHAPVEAETR